MDNPADLAFSPAIRAAQARKGSAAAYEGRRFADAIPPGLADWIEARDSAYLATASADGQPYVQHRGGPPGFLKVLDPHTVAFADYRGNRQYITAGNLSENPRAHRFLMDYAARERVKLWGRAQVTEDPEIVARLMPNSECLMLPETGHLPMLENPRTVAEAWIGYTEKLARQEQRSEET